MKKGVSTPCIVDLSEPLLEWARERNKKRDKRIFGGNKASSHFFPILCSINLLHLFTPFTYVMEPITSFLSFLFKHKTFKVV